MSVKKHGLSIGIERYKDTFFLVLKIIGRLTHEDYKIITPMLNSALAQVTDPKVDVLIDATELDGWDLRAAWDDFKLGLKHKNEFRRVAIHGNKNWQEFGAKLGNWFVSGEVNYFENWHDAYDWIASENK
jgi:hypothetical protein